MIKKHARQIWIVPVLLALAALACGGGPVPTATTVAQPTAQPTTQPTARPVATQAPAEATVTIPSGLPTADKSTPAGPGEPTATPPADQPTADTSTAAAPFELDTTPYVHKTGAFTVTLPLGWTKDEKAHSVYVTSPDKKVNIEISFENAGVKFDSSTLSTYIQAVEANWFGIFDSYTANKFEPQNDGSILVYKTLKLANGTARTAFSYYWQDDTVVYEQDFWVNTPEYDTYVKPLLAVANSMETDSAAGGSSTAYGITYAFTDPAKLFQFDVPYAWTQASQKGSNNSIVSFTSPDNRSSVKNFTFNDITAASTTDAGALARADLASFNNINDLKVITDKVQKDGSHLLVWSSAAGGIEGELRYETRGKTYLELTWVVDSADHDLFQPVWSTLVTSYAVPK